jgi:lysozyme
MSQEFFQSQKTLTADFEGLQLKPYLCTANRLTIGYGRNLSEKGLTEEEAEYLFANDLREAIAYAETLNCFKHLNDARKHVIVDMVFNLGPTRFQRFRNFLAALDAKNYTLAADEMRKSLWYTQVKRRARRLEEMMRTGQL